MRSLSFGIALFLAAVASVRAITITFDYSHDTNGFFTAHPTAKTDLETAAAFYGPRLADTLTAIVPGGGNTWSAVFTDPGTGATTSVANLSLAQNQLLVYVGGFDLGGSTLGLGGPGGFSAGGSQAFLDTVKARGQPGALTATPTDFGPWGGSIQFNLNATWYFDPTPATLESFTGLDDFYSTALHELGHVLGIGTAGAWDAQISSGNFVGAASTAAFGGPVPLDPAKAHWANNTMSVVLGTATAQETEMSPALTTGTRKLVTMLDAAGLSDIGWQVVPEPTITTLLCAAVGLGIFLRRFRPV